MFCLHVHSPSLGCVLTHTSLTYTLLLICSTGSHRSMEISREEYLTLAQAGIEWNNKARHSLSPCISIKSRQKVVKFSCTSITGTAILVMSSFLDFLQVRDRKYWWKSVCLDLVLIYCKSASDNRDKGLFLVTAGGSIELPSGEKGGSGKRIHSSQQAESSKGGEKTRY